MRLALGDDDAEIDQQRQQTRDCGLALVVARKLASEVLGEHEALEIGAEVGGDPGGQRCHDATTIRQLPALAAINDGHRFDDQILDDELLVALEAGAFGQALDLDVPGLVDRQLGTAGATPAFFARPFGRRLRRLLHAAGLDLGPNIQTLQPCDLVTQLGVLCLQPGIVLQNLHEQRLQNFETNPVDGAG